MAKGTDAAGWRDTTVVKDTGEEMDTAGEKDAAEVKNKGVKHTAELKRKLETSDTAVGRAWWRREEGERHGGGDGYDGGEGRGGGERRGGVNE
ncbi:hypothetical protein PF011_g32832 [Phytophthora fragariae]|uniref:Uncharacterized protein n=1 Tax=Phytophthora fragariae TaxID=53985 RepID=A0A6A3G581_9STRA|nr:hypothetical protein PF011_g32832 [Phytophthora fragariae]